MRIEIAQAVNRLTEAAFPENWLKRVSVRSCLRAAIERGDRDAALAIVRTYWPDGDQSEAIQAVSRLMKP